MKLIRLPNFAIFLLIFVAPLFLVAPLRLLINLLPIELDFSNFIIFIILHFGFCYAWELAIGTSLSQFLPAEQTFRRPVYFLLFGARIILFLYIIWICVTIDKFDVLFALSLTPAVILWYALTLFVRYQNSKIVRAVELNRSVKLNDFIIFFVLHNMLFFGVWVIQSSVTGGLRQRTSQQVVN